MDCVVKQERESTKDNCQLGSLKFFGKLKDLDETSDPLTAQSCSKENYLSENEDSKSHDSDSSLSCPKCFDIFQNESKYADHVLTHSPWYIMYVCGVCGLTLEKKDLLVKHVITHITPVETTSNNDVWENDPDYKIPVEDLMEKVQRESKKRIKKRSEFHCPKCPVAFNDEDVLREHFQDVHFLNEEVIEKKNHCDSCALSFPSRRELITHVRTHHSIADESSNGPKIHVCSTCKKTFLSRGELNQHMVMHSGLRPFVCESCGKTFARKSGLIRHDVKHTGVKPYTCTRCGKSFSYSKALRVHNYREHTEVDGEGKAVNPDGVPKTHDCETCGMNFFTRAELTQHSFVHSGEKPFQCPTCDKSFARKHALILHERVHTGEKPYNCGTCGRAFSSGTHLRRHIKVVHTGEKPHMCETCGKAFALKGKLRAHIRIHTSEKQ